MTNEDYLIVNTLKENDIANIPKYATTLKK
jgi:hypothetical protein